MIVGFGLAVLPYLAWFLLRHRLHDNAVLVALCVGTLLAVVTGGLFVSDAVARGRMGAAGGSTSASAARAGYQRGETAAISAFEYDAGNIVAPAGGSGTAQGEIAALASLKATADTAAADLAGLAAPVDLQADNQQLVDEFQGFAAYLDAEEQAVAAGDSAAADDARAHVDGIASGIDRTVASIDRKLGQ